MNSWIVVTDASRARLFSVNGHDEPPRLIRKLSHEASRARGSEVTTDKPGRMNKRAGAARCATADRHPIPKEIEAEHFAHELTRVLEDGRNRNAFANLAVAAPPHFLGLLRQTMSPQLKRHLSLCVGKDYTKVDTEQLSRRLKEVADKIGAEQRRRDAGK